MIHAIERDRRDFESSCADDWHAWLQTASVDSIPTGLGEPWNWSIVEAQAASA